MQDKLSAPAKAAASQLAALQNKLRAEQIELRRATEAMRQYQAQSKLTGVADIGAYRALSQRISVGKQNVAGLQDQITGQRDAALSAAEMGEEVGSLAPLYAAAGTAVLAFAAAVGAGVYAGAKLAIDAAEAKQDTLDMLEAMLGSAQAADDTYGRIIDITDSVAISQARATELARQLSAAGVTNKQQLVDAIQSIGEVESVLGGEAGSKIQNVLERAAQTGKFKLQAKQLVGTGVQVQKLYEEIALRTHKGVAQVKAEVEKGTLDAGVGISALNEVLTQKFGGAAARQFLDFGSQVQHFKDNVSQLFEDVDTGPFLDALHQILSVFDKNTESGRALKEIVTRGFDAIFRAATALAPAVSWVFKEMIILALEAYVWVKKNGETIERLKIAFEILGAVAAIALAPFIAMVAAATVGIGLAIGVVYEFLNAIGAVGQMISDEYNLFVSIGSYLIDGLVQGVKNGAAAVANAVTGIARDALNSFKNVLGIHSPSKVMAQMGGHLTMGLVEGIDRGAPAANDSLMNVVQPAAVERAAASGGGGSTVSASSGGVTVNITINGVQGAEQLKQDLPGIIADAFEQLTLQKGAPVAA